MSETVFRPEAVRRHAAGRAEAPEPPGGGERAIAVCWALAGLLLAAALVARPVRSAAAGLLAGGALAPGTAAAAVAGLAAAAGLALIALRAGRRRRVPVLLQMTATECGAACLAMVLSYFGRGTRVAELADALGVGRDGLSASDLARGARGHGMRVRAYSLAPAELACVPLPAIVHWEFNHFLVVERWAPRRVDVIDPASGRRRLSAAEFDAGFTGVTLVCEPAAGFERRAARRPRWLGQLAAVLWRHRGVAGQVLAASLLLQLLGLALPLLSKVVVDDVLPHRAHSTLVLLGAGLAVLVASQALLGGLRGLLLVRLRTRVDGRLVPALVERLLALPYRFFEQRRSGDLIARVASVSLIRETVAGQAISTVLDGSFAVGYVTLVLAQDAVMGAAVLVLAATQALLIAATARGSRDLTRRELAADAAAQSYLVEALSGVATLKASGAEPRAQRRWDGLFGAQLAAGARSGRRAAAIDGALGAVAVLAPLALLWLGAARVLGGHMSLGTMLATTALAAGALTPLSSLIASAERLQMVVAHVERLADIVLAAPEPPGAGAPRLSGAIALEAVGFRYDARSPLAVRDVSVEIAPGQKVAVVGRSGSGKSTLGKLLLALYDPTAGTIRYDGATAAGLDRRTLRRQFGVVLQEPVLFSGSIRDNIAFNVAGAPLDCVVAAAELAAIHEEIARMPMGYETRLAEGGHGLSGGQRQRLALARAVLARPAILLLDEATSHLDVVSEAEVERNLGALGCTRIVIAHRLSTVRDADLILVMEDGRIVERGDHAELLAHGGAYAALVEGQETVTA